MNENDDEREKNKLRKKCATNKNVKPKKKPQTIQ